jgi:hypothetical protein
MAKKKTDIVSQEEIDKAIDEGRIRIGGLVPYWDIWDQLTPDLRPHIEDLEKLERLYKTRKEMLKDHPKSRKNLLYTIWFKAQELEKDGMSRTDIAYHPEIDPLFKELSGGPPYMTKRHRQKILSQMLGKLEKGWPRKA